LAIRLKLSKATFLAGESIVAEATIENTSTSVVQLDGFADCSPFRYVLHNADDKTVVKRIAAIDYRNMRAGVAGRSSEGLETRTLAPGESLTIKDDVAIYAPSPIGKGRYLLTATHGKEDSELRSSPFHFEVVVPSSTTHRWSHSPIDNAFCDALAVPKGDSAEIYQTEAISGDPRDVAFLRRPNNDQHGIESLAIAMSADLPAQGRWVAAIGESKFSAVKGWGDIVTAGVNPIQLEGDPLRLLHPGFQISDGRAYFFASNDAQPTLVQFSVEPENVLQREIDMPWNAVPNRILLRASHADQRLNIDLVWVIVEGSTTQVWTAPLWGDGAKPTLLHTTTRPLLDIQLRPIVLDDESLAINTLWGPAPENSPESLELTYLRISVRGEFITPEEFTFAPPSQKVNEWAIAPDEHRLPLVAFVDQSSAYVQDASSTAGPRKLCDADGPSNPSLLADNDGKFWLSITDRILGIRRMKVRLLENEPSMGK